MGTDERSGEVIDGPWLGRASGFDDVDGQGYWSADLSMQLWYMLHYLALYVGVEFEDGRLDEIALAATDLVEEKIREEVRRGAARDVEPRGPRPSWLHSTPQGATREAEVEAGIPERELNIEAP